MERWVSWRIIAKAPSSNPEDGSFMRSVGGRAFTQIDLPWVQNILKKLDSQPIRAVIILRLVFIMHPSLNYLLALTSISFRDYLIGSAIGLVAPISFFVFLFDRLVGWLL